MLPILIIACCMLFPNPSMAQLPLPDPPWLPPDPSAALQGSAQPTVPNVHWSNLLGNALHFYEAQRSGALPNSNRVDWRGDAALEDGKDVGLDLAGGYFDAGNYILCPFPLAFTLTSIAHAALDYGQAFDLANQTAYLDATLRWGLDWLMRTQFNGTGVVAQVGSKTVEDDYWGPPSTLPSPRPTYLIPQSKPATDLRASLASSFASASVLYSGAPFPPGRPTASLTDPDYAAVLLQRASDLYAAARAGEKGVYQDALGDNGKEAMGYPSDGWEDDLTYAALWMALATNETSYYEDAASFYVEYSLRDQDEVLNWDSQTPAIPILASQLLQARPGINGSTGTWQIDAETYLDRVLAQEGRARQTRGGLLFYNGDSDDASLNPALNAATLMLRFAPLAFAAGKRDAYTKSALQQVDYALGKNPMKRPYVVGVHPNAPKRPHSAMAHGGTDIENIDTDPKENEHVLYGAVIGGPDKHDRYFDIRSDWPETEIALDYNAPVVVLAAYGVLNRPADPHYVSLSENDLVVPSGKPCDEAFSCDDGVLSQAAKIAIGVVVAVVVLVAAGVGWCFWRRRKVFARLGRKY